MRRSVFDPVKFGIPRSSVIPELSLIKVDLKSLPAVTDEQCLLQLLEEGEHAAIGYGDHFFSHLDWRRLAPCCALRVRAEFESLSPSQKKMVIRAMGAGLAPEYEEFLACIESVLQSAKTVRVAIRENDLFAAARWALSFGHAVLLMQMMLHKRNLKAGQGSRRGAMKGGKTRKIDDAQKVEIAKRYKVACDELVKGNPDLAAKNTLLTDKVGTKFKVAGRTVRNYLKLLK